MTYLVTYIEVDPGSTTQAIGLLKQYRETIKATDGDSGVDVLQESGRQNRFVTAEACNDVAVRTAELQSLLGAVLNSPNDQRVHHDFTVSPERRRTGSGALYIVTHVDVPPPRKDETEVLLKELAEQSRQDEGNTRYDIFQQSSRANHFTVCAIWESEKAFTAHQKQTHTRQFREKLGPMLGAPYDERLYKALI